MLQELQLLFTEMGPAAAVCLIAGLIFIIIELIIPGFGFFGITGGLLLLAGIILRLIDGGNGNPVAQFFLMLLILILILGAAFGLVALAAKKGWLNRTFLVDTGRAVPEGHTEGTKDYSGLIGKTGTTATMLRPAGIAFIDGVRYDVVAQGEYIAKDKEIIVETVEGARIVVKENIM